MPRLLIAFYLLLGVAIVHAGAPSAATADEQPDLAQQQLAEQLVRRLGDAEFERREQAAAELAGIGPDAVQALEAGAQAIDREIRYRSRRILADIRAQQFNSMLEAFLSGDGDSVTLPGWKRFRERIGDERSARVLFVDMQRAEPELLKTMDANLAQVAALVYPRARQVHEMSGRGQPPQLAEIAALVFVASDPDVEVSSTTYSYVSSLLHQPAIREAMAGGANKPLISKMMGQWVLRGKSHWAYQSLLLAMQYRLPEGVIAAENTLNEPNQATHVKQYAIMTIAKLGERKHVPVLERLLTDTGVLQTRTVNNVKSETQVRDVALAACAYLSGYGLREVGFPTDAMPEQQFIFNPSLLGFPNDEKRSAVFDKWRKLSQEQRKKEQEPAKP